MDFITNNLWILWLPAYLVAFLLGYILIRLCYQFIVYQLNQHKYKTIPRHSKTFAVWGMFDKEGQVEQIFDEFLNEDGTSKDVLHCGPWLDGKAYIMVGDLNTVKTILSTSDEEFPKMPQTYELLRDGLIGDGLVTSSGTIWKLHRKLITPLFHFKTLKVMTEAMSEEANILIDTIKQAGDVYHNAKKLIASLTMGVIIRLAFGAEFDSEWMLKKQFYLLEVFAGYSVERAIVGKLGEYIPFSYSRRLQSNLKEIQRTIAQVIKERREKIKTGTIEDQVDLLSLLTLAKDENGNYLPDKDIVDEGLTFLFAGYDTSSSTLCWMLYMLAKHPHVLKKLQNEVDDVLQGKQIPTSEDISKLNYARNVMKESQRLYPPVPSADRVLLKDMKVGDHILPAGTGVGATWWGLHRDPRYWSDPLTFNPDRFDNNEPKNSFAFLPFSAGTRNCLGQKFAYQEIVIVISMLVRQFNISYDESITPVGSFDALWSPRNLRIKFTPRF